MNCIFCDINIHDIVFKIEYDDELNICGTEFVFDVECSYEIPEKIAQLCVDVRDLIAGRTACVHCELDLDMYTPFQKRIFEFLRTVPRGNVVTYKQIASAVGNKNAARAVGNTMRKNRYPLLIPCHRVISSDLSIGGFSGMRTGPQIALKRSLLFNEGVELINNIVPEKYIWNV